MFHPYEALLSGCLWYRLNENALPGHEFTGEGVERNRSVREYLSLPFSSLAMDSSEKGGTSSVVGLCGCASVASQLPQQFRAVPLCSAPSPDLTITVKSLA